MKEYNHNPHKLCSVVSSKQCFTKHVSVTAVTPGAAGLPPDPAAAAGAGSWWARLVGWRHRHGAGGQLVLATLPDGGSGEDDLSYHYCTITLASRVLCGLQVNPMEAQHKTTSASTT